ncbi:MAG: MFS transporter [Thermoleophilia bacterium]|nr:MFS transporter [Thermoleophilia bacterium]
MESSVTFSQLPAAARQRLSGYQRRVTVIAFVSIFFLAADWYAYAAVMPFIMKDLDLDAARAGFAMGLFAITYAASMLVWGPLVDRFLPRRVMFVGLLGSGITMVGGAFVQEYSQALAMRGLRGVFDAAIFVAGLKLLSEWYPVEKRGTQMGLYLASYSLAITADFAVGIPIAESFGWRFYIGGLGVLTLILSVVVPPLVKNRTVDLGLPSIDWGDRPPRDVTFGSTIRTVMSQRWIYLAALGIFGCTFAISGTATWVVPSFLEVQGISVGQATLVGTLMGLSQVFFLVVGGRFSDSVRKRILPMRLAALLAMVSALMFALSGAVKLSFLLLVLFALLSGVAVFSGGAIFSMLGDKYSRAMVGTAGGFAEVMGVVASFVAPAAMGAIINGTGSFSWAFLFFAAVELVILGIFLANRDYKVVPAEKAIRAEGVIAAEGASPELV